MRYVWAWVVSFGMVCGAAGLTASGARSAGPRAGDQRALSRWVGTWAAAAQQPLPGQTLRFSDQTVRLIVHTSVGGPAVRIAISNVFGDEPLRIGAAHIALRAAEADIVATSDRTVLFDGRAGTTVPAHGAALSDPVEMVVPALSDVAVSLFLPDAAASTMHVLAKQTSYVSTGVGDVTATVSFPVGKKIGSWPFLAGVDVKAAGGTTIVAFGSSLTDGDGSSANANHRWPDALAMRLQAEPATAGIGVVNEGIIGNRLLRDSPATTPFGDALGAAGEKRFDRDVLGRAGVGYVVVALGINDIAFPGSITPATETVTADDLIAGYRRLIVRAHQRGIVIIGSTNPPFEGAFLEATPPITFFTPQKEQVRQAVNAWIRTSRAFDGVIDFDRAVRDPDHPARILPAYDSGDHLHPNDAGYAASAREIPLMLFEARAS